MKKVSKYKDPTANTKKDFEFLEKLEKYFDESIGTNIDKLTYFPKYVPRQMVALFLAKYEIYKKIHDIQGSIVECGILFGGGLMTWAQFSAIFEPVNYQRKIIGFDTFSGFPNISKKDKGSRSKYLRKKGFAVDSLSDLKRCIDLYDSNRFLSHMPKIELVKGNALQTIPKYLKDNPHAVVSLLYLDFDIYEPTKAALKNFVPRMPKGAIIAFDQLNADGFTGETRATLDTIGIRNLKIRRFDYSPSISYAVLE